MTLSKRLELAATLTPRVPTIADVGTDHGFLAVAFIEKKIAQRVIAIDVNRGPLESAQSHVREKGYASLIECRLGDGLGVTKKGEVDCAVICGMGGQVMEHIIKVGPELLPTYVLQPQSHRKELKQFLVSTGYGIVQEACVEENHQYYDVWVVKKGVSTVYDNIEESSLLWEFGALLQEQQDPIWVAHIHKQIHTTQRIIERMKETSTHRNSWEEKEKYLMALQKMIQP